MQPGIVNEQNVKGTPKNMNSIAHVITINCNVICNVKKVNEFILVTLSPSITVLLAVCGHKHAHTKPDSLPHENKNRRMILWQKT